MVRDGQWTIGTLTGRQMEVLDLLAEGMSTADIATKLWVSKATVRNHVQQIMERLDVHTRLAAVHAAHVYVHSPGQRIIDWCRSQRMHLESSQEVAIRRVFENKNAAPQAMPRAGDSQHNAPRSGAATCARCGRGRSRLGATARACHAPPPTQQAAPALGYVAAPWARHHHRQAGRNNCAADLLLHRMRGGQDRR